MENYSYKSDDERLQKQMDFILEIDRAKNIMRQTYLSDGMRKENDAEHSWHLAIMAFLLAEYANEDVNVLKVIKMVLIHDLVEIDAGDTYAYDMAGNKTKRAREEAAADRIFNILPSDQARQLRSLWEEFEAQETPEAKFAHALDKCQPILLNDASGGRSWKEHEVHSNQVLERNKKTPEGSRDIWKYVSGLIEKNINNGNLR